jgi:hypothetical protein
MKVRKLRRTAQRKDRGSALLISLMIMVGLSMLGLGFVAISEIESAISVNERNALQAQAAAEAGSRLVMEWFQDPDWGLADGAMPVNNVTTYPDMKTTRDTGSYEGVYKSGASDKLFDKPYKPASSDRFMGTEDSADIIIDDEEQTAAIIDDVNELLFGDADADVRIREIRVYAPPMTGAELVTDDDGNQFYKGGTRYGVATIACTASVFKNDTAIATRKVRLVVGEFPTPVPAGPIQSAAGGIDFGGSSNVHWGLEQSDGDLEDTKTVNSIPWANPYELLHFERGYDDEVWPVISGSDYDQAEYFNEVVGKTFEDPWFGTRAYGDNAVNSRTYQYQYDEDETDCQPPPTYCGRQYAAFENQNSNEYPTKKKVTFPVVDYDFWRRVAIQGRGTDGIFYFKYSGPSNPVNKGGLFKRNGTGDEHDPAYWIDTGPDGAALGGGFYFFETTTGANPQTSADPSAILTPAIAWQSSEVGADFLAEGFIYLNATTFRTQGTGSLSDRDFNMPGEPYRDIGYRQWEMNSDGTIGNDWDADADGAPIFSGSADDDFSYQDLNGNGRFDVIVKEEDDLTYDDDGTAGGSTSDRDDVYIPHTWHSNGYDGADCVMLPDDWNGTGWDETTDSPHYCSEPHEPYLNLIYPTVKTGSFQVMWQANDAQSQRKKTDATGTCAEDGGEVDVATIPDECTSNAWDEDGALVGIPAFLDGLMYVEGDYDSQGNAHVYGAMLAGGAVTGNGTMDFWFKQALTRGDYVPPGAPRVIAYSIQTDDVD